MIIAICGKKRSGKDTLADYIGYQKVKFAQPLKDALAALLGFTYEQLENDKEIVDPFWNITPRVAMQTFGEKFKEVIPDIFIKALFKKYPDNIVISDLRFMSEYRAVKERNGIVIKIIRDESDDNHISEKELETIPADLTIINNGTIEDLFSCYKQGIKKFI